MDAKERKNKCILGFVERKAQGYYFFHIESENRVEIEPLIRKYISPNAKLVVTDGAPAYK